MNDEIKRLEEGLDIWELELEENRRSGSVSGYIVSEDFEGMSKKDREGLVGDLLDKNLGPERKSVGYLEFLTPEESRVYWSQ